MSAHNDGGPAFPITAVGLSGHPGMTLRDYFAAAALQGLLASGQWHNSGTGFGDHIAINAMNIADAMLAARAEGRSDDK